MIASLKLDEKNYTVDLSHAIDITIPVVCSRADAKGEMEEKQKVGTYTRIGIRPYVCDIVSSPICPSTK